MATKAFSPFLHKVRYMYIVLVKKRLQNSHEPSQLVHELIASTESQNLQTVTGDKCVDLANRFSGCITSCLCSALRTAHELFTYTITHKSTYSFMISSMNWYVGTAPMWVFCTWSMQTWLANVAKVFARIHYSQALQSVCTQFATFLTSAVITLCLLVLFMFTQPNIHTTPTCS